MAVSCAGRCDRGHTVPSTSASVFSPASVPHRPAAELPLTLPWPLPRPSFCCDSGVPVATQDPKDPGDTLARLVMFLVNNQPPWNPGMMPGTGHSLSRIRSSEETVSHVTHLLSMVIPISEMRKIRFKWPAQDHFLSNYTVKYVEMTHKGVKNEVNVIHELSNQTWSILLYWWRSFQTYKKCIYKTYLFLTFQVEDIWTQMVPKLLLQEENQVRCRTRCRFRKIMTKECAFIEHSREINIDCIPKEF